MPAQPAGYPKEGRASDVLAEEALASFRRLENKSARFVQAAAQVHSHLEVDEGGSGGLSG